MHRPSLFSQILYHSGRGLSMLFWRICTEFFAQSVHIRHARGHTKRSTNGTERRCAPWRTAKTRTRTAIRIRTSSRRRTSRISRTNRTSRIRTRSNTYLKGWPQHSLRPTFLSRRFHSAPRRVFFAAYTPPQKTDWILFAPCAARTL